VREQLESLPQPEISFNYLGQFDQVLGATSLFGLAPEDSGPSQSSANHRPWLLDITASITGGQLRLVIAYSENIYRRSTIERFASLYIYQLRVLSEHCRTAGVSELTPSDFALAGLDDSELSKVLGQVGRGIGK
jgi:non-ribosomal peptide synthase protein (TIGR01720 family)